MGTKVIIDVYAAAGHGGGDGAAARPDGPLSSPLSGLLSSELSRQLAEAVAILHRADETFSTWRPDSPVSRLRRGEITSAQAPPEVAEVLARCAVARDLSGGWCDPWAAFRASGICGVLVNAAGDIATAGGPGDGRPFRVGITDPRSPHQLAEIVELTGAIATSGTYERGDHLIDPHSGRPAARAASASVTGPDLGLADALATAAAVAGEPGLALIAELDGYEALIINPDGARRWTERFPLARQRAYPAIGSFPPAPEAAGSATPPSS
jgi:thiamine biosynthesis lipoprotein